MTDLRCVDKACLDGPREDDQHARPRWATIGLLCTRCAHALEQRLAELPARRDQLRTVLGGRQGAVRDGSRRTKGSPPVPLNLDAHDHLVAMHATVVSWVHLVCEERGLRGPDRDDVAYLAPWLVAQIDWIVGQPWVDDLADEVRDVSRVADALTQVRAAWHRLDAPCPGCDARELGRWDGDSAVTCQSCGEQWPEDSYRRLVLVLASDTDRSVDVAGAALLLGVQRDTVRQWVKRGKIKRLTVDGQARYSTVALRALAQEEAG